MKRGVVSIKDEVIPLLPNQPSTHDEDLHEEVVALLSCLFHHRMCWD
jgi:hypothetical protein